MAEVPSALAHLEEIASRIGGSRLAVFLDYDGTLTPIVARPDLAVLSAPMRETLKRLASRFPVAVVSGRDLPEVRGRVGLRGLFYAGSHGFDIAGPAGRHLALQQAADALPALDAAEAELREALARIEGALIERKRFAIAVHYRLVREGQLAAVEEAVDRTLRLHSPLRKGYGKKVFELLPAVDWDKGAAVRWLLRALELDRPEVLPLYIGDDVTDEDAFRALAKGGIGIAVLDHPRPTAAHYALKDTDEVKRFLDALIEHPEVPR